MHADDTARHGEGIDRIIADDEELERLALVGAARGQALAQALHVIVDFDIGHDIAAGHDVGHDLVGDFLFLQRRQHGGRYIAQLGQAIRHGRGCEQGAQQK